MLPAARLTGISSPIATQKRAGRRPRLAARHRHHHRADEADRDARHAEQVRPPDAEQDRQHQRDDRRQGEHDAGVAGAEMRDGRKHQQVGNGVGNRRGNEEIAQPVRRGAIAPAATATATRSRTPPAPNEITNAQSDRRHAGLRGELAERQRQPEQAAGDDQQADGRIPEWLHLARLEMRRQRAQFRSSGNTGIGMNSTPSSAAPRLFGRRLAIDAARVGFAEMDLARLLGELVADIVGVFAHLFGQRLELRHRLLLLPRPWRARSFPVCGRSRRQAPSAPCRPWASRRAGNRRGRASAACRNRHCCETRPRIRARGRRAGKSGSRRRSLAAVRHRGCGARELARILEIGNLAPRRRRQRRVDLGDDHAPARHGRPRRGCCPMDRRSSNGHRSRGRPRAGRPARRRSRRRRSRWRGRAAAHASAPRRSGG